MNERVLTLIEANLRDFPNILDELISDNNLEEDQQFTGEVKPVLLKTGEFLIKEGIDFNGVKQAITGSLQTYSHVIQRDEEPSSYSIVAEPILAAFNYILGYTISSSFDFTEMQARFMRMHAPQLAALLEDEAKERMEQYVHYASAESVDDADEWEET